MAGSGRVVLTRIGTAVRYTWSRGAVRRWTLYGLGILAAVWMSWLVVTGLVARQDAAQISDRLDQVRTQIAQGDLVGARRTAATIPELADRAHNLTSGPAWWTAASIPYLGRPFEIVRAATAVADEVGRDGIPALLDVAVDLDPAKLRTGPRTVDLRPLEDGAPRLAEAAATLQDAVARLDAAPHSSWLPPVDSVRSSLAATLQSVTGYVDAGARTARALPTILGADGPKRYFVGLQNEAELRGTGGLPGAFAIVEARNGTVRFTHFLSDNELLPKATRHLIATGLHFGAEYDRAYGASGPTELFPNSNLSPHFPYAAQIWAAMWTKHSGEHVDGAIAVDPQVLANFLAATGPVTTRQGIGLDAETVVPFTEHREYTLFPDNFERKQFLVDTLHAVADRILDGTVEPIDLVRAMSVSGRQHRVLFWTADAAIQRLIGRTDFAGEIPADDRPFVGVVLNNIAGGKLDYFLVRSVDYQGIGCGSGREMVVTITLKNNAPASGLPPYVAGAPHLVGPDATAGSGDNRTLLDYYATAGAQLLGVTIDGDEATAAVLHDRGHPVYRFDLALPHGGQRTIELHLAEPAGSGPLQVWRQPGVVPIRVSGALQRCG